MAVKDNQKNKEYVAKHRTAARATMGEAEYKKKEAEARALRRQKEKVKKAQEAITLPPLKLSGANELFDLPKLQPLDINNLIYYHHYQSHNQKRRNGDANQNHTRKLMII